MNPVAVDWDLTLVDGDGNLYPGAVAFIRRLRKRGYQPFVHSCRANWQGGREQIAAVLNAAHLDMEIVGKPAAVAYIDNLAVRFDGDYTDVFNNL